MTHPPDVEPVRPDVSPLSEGASSEERVVAETQRLLEFPEAPSLRIPAIDTPSEARNARIIVLDSDDGSTHFAIGAYLPDDGNGFAEVRWIDDKNKVTGSLVIRQGTVESTPVEGKELSTFATAQRLWNETGGQDMGVTGKTDLSPDRLGRLADELRIASVSYMATNDAYHYLKRERGASVIRRMDIAGIFARTKRRSVKK